MQHMRLSKTFSWPQSVGHGYNLLGWTGLLSGLEQKLFNVLGIAYTQNKKDPRGYKGISIKLLTKLEVVFYAKM